MRTVPHTATAAKIDAEKIIAEQNAKRAIFIAIGFMCALFFVAIFVIIVISATASAKLPECGYIPEKRSNLITNGTNVKAEQFPFYVSLKLTFYRLPHCGASIISPYWVLTAKHCVTSKLLRNVCKNMMSYCFEVVAGSLDALDTSNVTFHRVYSIVTFSQSWDDDTFANDIALLAVYPPIRYRAHTENRRGVTSVCLPALNDQLNETTADIVGFGHTAEFHNIKSKLLRSAKLNIVNQSSCVRDVLNKDINEFTPELKSRFLCAGVTSESKGGCGGDSGGPLTIMRGDKVVQIGVAVAISPKGCGDRPTLFTDVFYYRKWIQDITGV